MPVAQQVAAVFSVEVSFREGRRLLPALPQEPLVRWESPVFDLVALRQCSRWARPFSFLLRPLSAVLLEPEPASAREQARRLASAPLRQLASSVQSSSFSVSEFESSRLSEIDPEDSPKSPPVLAPGAHRRSKHQCTQRREPLRANASGKSSAQSREGQIDGRFVTPWIGYKKTHYILPPLPLPEGRG